MLKTLKRLNLILLTISLVTLVALKPTREPQVYAPKNLDFTIGYKNVDRVEVLERFFEKYDSPLVESSQTFVSVADEYKIDYRILPAIACQESTCGKFQIDGTYNPFGWGVYGDNYIAFESYDHAIQEVGNGLQENYFSRGFDTIHEIAPIYTPPSNGSWSRGVTWFSNQIDDIATTI